MENVFSHASGLLIVCYLSSNKASFQNILGDQVHPFKLMFYPNGNGYFQQDNASFNSAGIVHDLFKIKKNLLCLEEPPSPPNIQISNRLIIYRMKLKESSDIWIPNHSIPYYQKVQFIKLGFEIQLKTYQLLVESISRKINSLLKGKDGITQY